VKTRLDKFKAGLRTNPVDMIKRAVLYSAGLVWAGFETFFVYLYRVLVFPLPSRSKAGLKHTLNPRVKLDYPRQDIFLHADSGLSVRRARACEKEPETVGWIEASVKAGDVMYDVGANIGAYSLVASKFLRGQVDVYAFEPGFSTYDQLCRNILLNRCQDSVHPFMLALNSATGMVDFDYHSLDAGDAEHRLVDRANAAPPSTGAVYRQRLLGFRLDDLVSEFGFPQPNHMKLDVDGSELAVLQGATKAIQSESFKSILVEVRKTGGQADQVRELLCSSGFELTSAHDRGDGIIWNYIFKKEGKIDGTKSDR